MSVIVGWWGCLVVDDVCVHDIYIYNIIDTLIDQPTN